MRFVDSVPDLAEVARSLSSAPTLYLDTEFDSSKAGQRLSLVQISRGEGEEVFVVDALRLRDLAALKDLLRNPDVEWVMHSAAQDLLIFESNLGLKASPKLFDTQVVWSLIGPEYSVSLTYLVFRLLGVRGEKAYQMDDWLRRPLPSAQLEYAAKDVETLPSLQRTLLERANELGRASLIHDVCREALFPELDIPERMSLASFRNAWQLGPRSQAALRRLVSWYNGRMDAGSPPRLDPKTLLGIASRFPKNKQELGSIKGVSHGFVDRHGDILVDELRAVSVDERDFQPLDPPPYATFEEIRAEAWVMSARAELCSELSVCPELAMPQRILKSMKNELLETGVEGAANALRGWRERLLAAPFRSYAAKSPPQLGAGERTES